MNECTVCQKLYLWALKFEFHVIFMCHKIYSSFDFFQPFKMCYHFVAHRFTKSDQLDLVNPGLIVTFDIYNLSGDYLVKEENHRA